MVRPSIASGRFYPAESEKLRALIRNFIDDKAEKEDVISVVAPHAGYVYSGGVAGAVYSRIKPADTCVIMGPNHTGMGKPFSIMTGGVWQTPLGEIQIDTALSTAILANSKYLQEDRTAHLNEHSVEVQLPFLQYLKPDVKFVPIVIACATLEVYQEIGRAVSLAVKDSDKKALIIASSDMTHYEPRYVAMENDNVAIEAILDLDGAELLNRVVRGNISMCGYAPVVAMLTAANELGGKKAELVSYRNSGDATGDYASVVGYAGIIVTGHEMPPLVKLAKDAVEAYTRQGRIIQPPAELAPEMKERAGVFVSLKKDGDLRGCIGTFEPTRVNVADEIIHNAVSAATRDPRFLPVSSDELKSLSYSVDVLSSPEPTTKAELDPKKFGVIVECGWRRGLLLPDLAGVDTVEEQLSICCQKAGIHHGEPLDLYKFQVRRYR